MKHIGEFIESGQEKNEVYYKDEEGFGRHEWKLTWSQKPRQCHIGKGWYEYCIENELEEGDKLSFEFNQYDGLFILSLTRS